MVGRIDISDKSKVDQNLIPNNIEFMHHISKSHHLGASLHTH